MWKLEWSSSCSNRRWIKKSYQDCVQVLCSNKWQVISVIDDWKISDAGINHISLVFTYWIWCNASYLSVLKFGKSNNGWISDTKILFNYFFRLTIRFVGQEKIEMCNMDEYVIRRLSSSILFNSTSDSYQTQRFRNIRRMNKSYEVSV